MSTRMPVGVVMCFADKPVRPACSAGRCYRCGARLDDDGRCATYAVWRAETERAAKASEPKPYLPPMGPAADEAAKRLAKRGVVTTTELGDYPQANRVLRRMEGRGMCKRVGKSNMWALPEVAKRIEAAIAGAS